MVTQLTRVSSHSSQYGSSLLDRQEDLRTRTWRPYGWSGREYVHVGHISECHSASSSSSWSGPWGESTTREESSLELCGKVIQRKWETDRWTKRNHWYKHNWYQRKIVGGCWQAYCAVRLIRSPTPNPTSSQTLCSVCEKCEIKLNGIRRTITSRIWIESTACRRTDLQCEPENFTDRIIFMSMYTDIERWAKGNKERCEYNS